MVTTITVASVEPTPRPALPPLEAPTGVDSAPGVLVFLILRAALAIFTVTLLGTSTWATTHEKVLYSFGTDGAEIAIPALRIAARSGDQVFYDKIMANLKAAKTPEAYFTDIFVLSRFSDPKLVEETLEFAISPEMRSQDAPYLISGVMQDPAAEKQAWAFVQMHWANIENLGGAFAGGVIVQSTGGFCDAEMRDQVQAFFTSHPAPAAERSLKQSVERMTYCVDMKAQQGLQLSSWLQQRELAPVK